MLNFYHLVLIWCLCLQGATFSIDNNYFFQKQMLMHLYPKFKIEYKYSLLLFSGFLYSFELLSGIHILVGQNYTTKEKKITQLC